MEKLEAALNSQDMADEVLISGAGIQAVKEFAYSAPIQRLVDEH